LFENFADSCGVLHRPVTYPEDQQNVLDPWLMDIGEGPYYGQPNPDAVATSFEPMLDLTYELPQELQFDGYQQVPETGHGYQSKSLG
jgi:hypothetical protein